MWLPKNEKEKNCGWGTAPPRGEKMSGLKSVSLRVFLKQKNDHPKGGTVLNHIFFLAAKAVPRIQVFDLTAPRLRTSRATSPMKTFMLLAIAAAQVVAAAGSSIVLESFDKPKHHWEAQNDPGLDPLSYLICIHITPAGYKKEQNTLFIHKKNTPNFQH